MSGAPVPAPWSELADLHRLVDDEAAAVLLRDAGLPPGRFERGGLRLKPGPGAVLAFRWHADGAGGDDTGCDGYVAALAGDRARVLVEKWRRMRPATTPLGEGVRPSREGRSAVFLFPNDRHLRALRFVAEVDKLKRTLARIPGIADAGFRVRGRKSVLRTVRYKPERRWIARAAIDLRRDADGASATRRVFLRFFPDARGLRLLETASALRGAGLEDLVPRPLAALLDGRLFVEEEAPGASLAADPDLAARRAGEMGRAVARLHASGARLVPAPGAGPLLADAAAALGTLARADRTLREPARALLRQLESWVPPLAPAVPVHGDLHLGQFVAGEESLRLVDFERAGMGAAARDIGNLRANLEALALLEPRHAESARELRDRFEAGYRAGAAPPDERACAFYETLARVELAALRLRRLEDRWPEKAAALLEAALRATGTEPRRKARPATARFFAAAPGRDDGVRWEVFHPRASGAWPGYGVDAAGARVYGTYDPAEDRFEARDPLRDDLFAPALAAFPRARLVSCRAGQRAVLRDEGRDGVRYLKVLPAAKAARLGRRSAAGAGARRAGPGAAAVLATPRLDDRRTEAGWLCFDELPGTSLHDLVMESSSPEALPLDRVAEALLTFHALPVAADELPPAPAPVAPGTWLELTLPHLGRDEARAWKRAAAQLPPAPEGGARGLVHGDLHDRNLVVMGAARVGVLDLDMIHVGPLVQDAGNLAAHLALRVLQRGGPAPASRSMARAWLARCKAAGATFDDAEARAVVARTLFRLACLHRFRRPWMESCPTLLRESRRWSGALAPGSSSSS